MTSFPSEDFLLFDLNREKIKKEFTLLRDIIAHLQHLSSTSELSVKAEQSIKTIIPLLKIEPLEILSPLFQQLAIYFQAVQKGLLIKSPHIETIAAILGEVLHLLDVETYLLVQALQNHKNTLIHLQHQLFCFIKEFENQIDEQKDDKKIGTTEFFSTTQTIHLDSIMFDLFCVEIETQCKVLNQGLLEIEKKSNDQMFLESLMRSAHSIKGAARVVGLDPIVRLAHVMEDCFVSAQQQSYEISNEKIDQLLRSVDLIEELSKIKLNEISPWLNEKKSLIERLIQDLKKNSSLPISSVSILPVTGFKEKLKNQKDAQLPLKPGRVLRITAENLNRLMGLAGESLIESRWLYPFEENLQEFKSKIKVIAEGLDKLKSHLNQEHLNIITQNSLSDLHNQIHYFQIALNECLEELDYFINHHTHLSDRLYQEVISSRMRPFADGVEAFPRMVRDLARQTGKKIKFEIEGQSNLVDREILEKMEAPLGHLLRNAIDHGIELPEERMASGKPPEGWIKLEAHHREGMLFIKVSDDGKGIDIEYLRAKILEKKLVSAEIAKHLTDSEIIDFLFLPGFSTSNGVTEISGRGMGLNVVQNMVKEVGGRVRTESILGQGVSFYLQLPLTLSVIRALIVKISQEKYALPLARIDHAFFLAKDNIERVEHRQYFHNGEKKIGLVYAWNLLELNNPKLNQEQVPVIVMSDLLNQYGLIVDQLVEEKELVVQALDPRLGKIPDVSAGAIMEDGSPIIILDIDDMFHSMKKFLSDERSLEVIDVKNQHMLTDKKCILIVEDSLTVREVECRLLLNQGYQVEVAVNGIDGWNAVRTGDYDLVITDIDMPRMNGIELLQAIKNDVKLHKLPVIILSYKESLEEKNKGLAAGADAYLNKSSFHDRTLIETVKNLIGNSEKKMSIDNEKKGL